LKVIIPAAGRGRRFQNQDYYTPKPFMKINGSSILERQLLEFSGDDIQVVLLREHESHPEFSYLKNKYNATWIFCGKTNSVIETLKHADTSGSIVVIDCDILIDRQSISKGTGNFVMYFNDRTRIPRYSYLQTKGSEITRITEKVKTSDMACCGVYGYKDGLPKTKSTTEEKYQSHLIQEQINTGEVYRAIEAGTYINLGTPSQVHTNRHKVKDIYKIYCFDLDNTLVTPSQDGSHNDCKPIHENINLVKELYARGNKIIIHTARRMATHAGDAKKAEADIGETTKSQLDKYSIPYHELVFGKPYADTYVDDKAINARPNTRRSIGYHEENKTRHFNKITEIDNTLIKEGRTVSNEAYWYESINQDWREVYTPRTSYDQGKLMMQKLKGQTVSSIYIGGDNFSLQKTVEPIIELHSKETKPTVSKQEIKNFYLDKLKARHEHKNQIRSNDLYEKLHRYISEYECERVTEIHGDPVFTNIIASDEGYKYIDPRGAMLDKKTAHGDPMYDYAKMYQSIVGYDFIITGSRIYESYIEENAIEFEKLTETPRVELNKMAAYLYYTLTPLHTENRYKFNEMAKKLIN